MKKLKTFGQVTPQSQIIELGRNENQTLKVTKTKKIEKVQNDVAKGRKRASIFVNYSKESDNNNSDNNSSNKNNLEQQNPLENLDNLSKDDSDEEVDKTPMTPPDPNDIDPNLDVYAKKKIDRELIKMDKIVNQLTKNILKFGSSTEEGISDDEDDDNSIIIDFISQEC